VRYHYQKNHVPGSRGVVPHLCYAPLTLTLGRLIGSLNLQPEINLSILGLFTSLNLTSGPWCQSSACSDCLERCDSPAIRRCSTTDPAIPKVKIRRHRLENVSIVLSTIALPGGCRRGRGGGKAALMINLGIKVGSQDFRPFADPSSYFFAPTVKVFIFSII
jgi:hypothetical protein